MAKTKSPLLSSSASGTIGKSLIYSKKLAGSITRSMHYPKKEPTLKQWTRRHIVGLLTAHWQCMSDAEHTSWNDLAVSSKSKLPGYHYFLKLAQSDLYAHHGLVGYWSFNEETGNTFFDYSGNSFHGTLGPSYPDNCPSRVSSFKKDYGNALSFDGIDDYGFISHDPKFDITDQITIESWIKLIGLSSGTNRILRKWRSAVGERCYMTSVYNNKFEFFYSQDGSTTNFITSSISLSLEWTHVVAVLGLDNITRLFINSIQDSTTGSLASLNTFTQNIALGILNPSEYFYGSLDEIRIYNRALSYNEIKKHYQLLRLDKKRQPLLRL